MRQGQLISAALQDAFERFVIGAFVPKGALTRSFQSLGAKGVGQADHPLRAAQAHQDTVAKQLLNERFAVRSHPLTLLE